MRYADVDTKDLGKLLLPQPKSWEEVYAITGGLRDVTPEEIKAGYVATKYDLPPTDFCGVLGCRRKHGKGGIIALPDSRFVNIGHCCVDSHFPDEMQAKWADHSDAVRRMALAQSIDIWTSESNEKLVWCDLIESEATRLTTLCEDFRRRAPSELANKISKRAYDNDSEVWHHRSVSRAVQDAERVMLQGGRVDKLAENMRVATYERIPLGTLTGLTVFKAGCDPLAMLHRLRKLAHAVIADATSEDEKKIKNLPRIARELAPYMNDLRESMVAAEGFFSDQNIVVLLRMPETQRAGITRIEVLTNAVSFA